MEWHSILLSSKDVQCNISYLKQDVKDIMATRMYLTVIGGWWRYFTSSTVEAEGMTSDVKSLYKFITVA